MADDCLEAADVLCEGLRLHNYDASVAHTGQEALDLCAAGGIDLILLDVCLPDIDGYEVCRRLKDNPRTQDTVVVFVTVKGAPEDISLGRRLGAADYITKPYNLPMVMLRLDAALRHKHIEDRLRIQSDDVVEAVYTDHLTGLRTRHYLLERLEEEVEKTRRHSYPVSCVVFDIDEIAPISDAGAGVPMDDLLVEVAIMLRDQARACDVIARSDVTEFAAVLPYASINDAMTFATRIVDRVGETTFCCPTHPLRTGMRSGIVTCRDGAARGADHVFREAMCRLLEAKSLGDDRRVVAKHITAA